MTALTAANVTVVVNERRRVFKRMTSSVTLTFGDGSLTYPAGGVPMPDFHSFGYSRFMSGMSLTDPGSANGFLYKYDKTNNKLRIYQGDNTNAAAAPNVELGGVAVAATTIKADATGF